MAKGRLFRVIALEQSYHILHRQYLNLVDAFSGKKSILTKPAIRLFFPIPVTYVCGQKKFESYFSDRLTFSNVHGRTSRRIYRLALPLHAPETLSSSSKSRIFLYNAHLVLCPKNDTIKHISKYRHLANLPWK